MEKDKRQRKLYAFTDDADLSNMLFERGYNFVEKRARICYNPP